MNQRELPKDRLATTDQHGNRIYLYPADVKGIWRTRRNWLNRFLILFFLILPWIRIRGHQSILLDIYNGKFAVFGLAFWAHDAPILLFIFGGAALVLAFVTAIWGRVWCGWACPQTVFVDGVFRKIERWIEGDAVKRRQLDSAPLSSEKLMKKTLKWGLFSAIALLISHSFLAYFAGTEELAQMMARSPSENPGSFLIVFGIALFILFDFGWFREQFCTLVCPYGRFQSVLMDQQSSVVTYDQKRGEPRKGSFEPPKPTGDCVNCYKCVQVCPTGIDIRRGVQLECIACTACIDACDEVMSRLQKPKGLIRYGTAEEIQEGTNPRKTWKSRYRVWIYGTVILIFMMGLMIQVRTRRPMEVTWIRAIDTPYQVLSGASQKEVINHYKIDLRNQTFEEQKVTFPKSIVQNEKTILLVTSTPSVVLKAGQAARVDIFIRFPLSLLSFGNATIPIETQSESVSQKSRQEVIPILQEVRLVGPTL